MCYPTYNGIGFTLKEEGDSDTCYSMDESWGHYAKQNKPVIKINIQYDSTFIRYPEYSKSETQSRTVVARVWGKERGTESYCLIGRVSVLQKGKEFWRWMAITVAQQWKCT